MAKKHHKTASNIHTTVGTLGAELLGLEPPFSSGHTRSNKHFLYIHKGDGFMGIGFAATYAARKFLDILLEDDELTLTRGITGVEDTIVSSTGIKIRADDIMKIIDYKYDEDETKWELPDSGSESAESARRFRNSAHVRYEPTEHGTTERKPKKEKIEKAPKPSKEGLITIGDIATELKMEARDCRAILRKMKTPKPGVGWAWSKTEVDSIKKIINDNKE